VIAVTQAGEWRRGLNVIETEQRRLASHGVTAAELTREIAELRTALTAAVAGAATRQSVALSEGLVAAVDGDDVFTAPAENLRLFEAAVPALTPERVGAAARALFAGEPLLAMASPTAVEGGEATLLAAYRESRAAPVALAAAQQAQTWPYAALGTPGRVVERRELAPEIGATVVRFANGVRLTVKHTTFADDQILVAARIGHGRLDFAADRPSLEWALPVLPNTGLGRISAEDMQQALAGRAYGASFGVDDDAFELTGGTRPEDFALQLQVLAAYVSDPGWRPAGWDRIRGYSGTIHDQLASTPGGVFSRDAGILLHSGDRRWAIPSREEMAASSIADARAVLERPLAQGPIEVVIVGDINVDEAIRQTAATFGALPPRADVAVPAATIRFPAGTSEPIQRTHNGRADQGLAYIAWPSADFFSDIRRSRALNLLSDVFQLRLLQEIRERQGTTYSPRAGHAASETFAGYGVLSAQIEARPEALAGFLRDAERIAASLRDTPVDADELQRALRPRLETVQRQRNGNVWWLGNLGRIQDDPRVAASITSQIADYQAVTPADLQRLAREYLQPGRAWKMIVTPREGAPAS
jgi:zinc protease